ncbi:MAG: cofactor-independent phosphoglycerate mutase [Cellulosilyticaceae bacterium]
MKYVVILVDGMADEELKELGHKSPLAYAHTPHIAKLAECSEIGTVKTIPLGCPKGSDTANLSVLGYDPQKYYFGRSPLEALSIGVDLKESDVTFRVNLITVSEEEDYEEKKILDYSADEITTEEANQLIQTIAQELGDKERQFYPGVSYRHLLVWDGGSTQIRLTPPHDILGKSIKKYKPKGINELILWEYMKRSYDILKNHPINQRRIKEGLKPANSIWIWGEGTKPTLPNFYEKYGIRGAVISAVDLIKGIGIGAGMRSINVAGVTGTVHTNYEGKTQAAINWLIQQDQDFVYIHLEGPDECGHQGDLKNKIKAIELIDEKILGPILYELEKNELEHKIMILPDHPTPVKLRTHTDDAVPFMIYCSNLNKNISKNQAYTEKFANMTKNNIENGYMLMNYFLTK